jgi:hypothetical protein
VAARAGTDNTPALLLAPVHQVASFRANVPDRRKAEVQPPKISPPGNPVNKGEEMSCWGKESGRGERSVPIIEGQHNLCRRRRAGGQ